MSGDVRGTPGKEGVRAGMLLNPYGAQDGPQTMTQSQYPQCQRREPLIDREGVIVYHTPDLCMLTNTTGDLRHW